MITGGAVKSIINISIGLKKEKEYHIDYYFGILNIKILKMLDRIGLGYYFLIPQIFYAIKKYKPDIIVTQSRITFAATIAAKLNKIPIVNFVRDPSDFCPKFVNIIDYGVACPEICKRKVCYPCIDKWRSLRVLIGNKPKGWEFSLKSIFSTINYKIRYIFCRLNLFVLNKAEIILVASELMKSFLSCRVDSAKIKIINITPIKKHTIYLDSKKKNQFLFVIPSYEASHKGLDFVLKLTRNIPKRYKINIVGGLIPENKLNGIQSKINNLGYVSSKELNELYQTSKITLVPSFFTEAFGRVIIESIVNGTPVISSPNCGANLFLQNKDYIKIVELNPTMWLKEIRNMIERNYKINLQEIKHVYELFSISKSVKDFSNLIKRIV